MEPPRHEEGMDEDLAAALGIQISDERTQEANVLGARLAIDAAHPGECALTHRLSTRARLSGRVDASGG